MARRYSEKPYTGGEPDWILIGGDLYAVGEVRCTLSMMSSGPEESRLWDIWSDCDYAPPMYVLYGMLDALPKGPQRVRIHGVYFVWDGDTLHEVELDPQPDEKDQQ